MNLSNRILSDLIIHQKYAKYIPTEERRENWEEIVTRNEEMHIKAFPHLETDIRRAHNLVRQKRVVPSMRSLQFAGKAIEIMPNRMYNCCYLPVETPEAFAETMFLLLGGTGVGYSVQNRHVKKLPPLKPRLNEVAPRYLVQDSIIGWAEAIRVLMLGFFNGKRYRFDYRDIRPKGAELVTSGGKAPGPEPLKECIDTLSLYLEKIIADRGVTQLTSIEAHDIQCILADAVLAGGIRRAAMISLFSNDDELMLHAKSGNWWETHPYRARANNSAVLMRGFDGEHSFNRVFNAMIKSKSGEPGFLWTNNLDWGTNPCAEISLKPYQFCNLTEISCANIVDENDFLERIWAATFLGTLQAAHTDFPYLRPIWKQTTEEDALLGVSLTGTVLLDREYDWEKLTSYAKLVNEEVAKKLGINPASRITTIKPSGCMLPETEIRTSKGLMSLETIFKLNDYDLDELQHEASIFLESNEEIYVYDKDNNLQPITKLFVNGVDDTFDIEMEDGLVVSVTPNHRFLTKDRGWVMARDLEEGDDIVNFE